MKKKRTFVGLAVVMAVLLLGIGYATITNQTLTINGTMGATASDSNFNVEFTAAQAGKATHGSATAEVTGTHGKEATFAVNGMTNKGDQVEITYTVTNQSAELSAKLGAPEVKLTGNENGFFEVTSEYTSDVSAVAHGATATLKVTVKLVKTPAADVNGVKATITSVASPVQPAA